MKREARLQNLSSVPYQEAWDLQRSIHQKRVEGRCLDTLLLVEHEPVLTMGRRTKDEHWKRNIEALEDHNIGVYQIERGGSVTYHGPGQVVGYPILRLQDYCSGPKVYVGMLQEVIIRVLADWEIKGILKEKFPGVWIENKRGDLQKIAAIGVRITRGVTMHGLALNVNVNLKPFQLITPCGIEGCQVTSMEQLLSQQIDVIQVKERLVYHFADVFALKWEENNDSKG